MIDAAALAIGLLVGGFSILAVVAVILAIGALISVFRNEDFSGGAKGDVGRRDPHLPALRVADLLRRPQRLVRDGLAVDPSR
jgi:hypothetical protein